MNTESGETSPLCSMVARGGREPRRRGIMKREEEEQGRTNDQPMRLEGDGPLMGLHPY